MSLLIEDDYPEPVDPQQAATRQPGWLGRRPWPAQARRAPGPPGQDRGTAAARQLLIADHEPRRGAPARAPDAHYPPPGQSRYENPYGNPYPAGVAGDLRYPGEVLDDDASGDLDEDLDQDPDEGEAGDEDPYYPEPAGRGPHPGGLREYVTAPQRLGGILLAAASVLAVALYVPSVLAADQHSFTGVVSNSAISSLNFGATGRVGTVLVHLGQAVRKGQVLATEDAPTVVAALQADRVAVAADKSNLAALLAESAPASSIATVENELASDRARRAAARTKVLATEIVAPAAGAVVAIYGQAGATATPAGLRGSAGPGQAALRQQPQFSLLPSGPMASLKNKNGLSPVLALRTSGGWQVRLLIPQSSVAGVRVGKSATISVPAADLSGVRGTVTELSPTPVSTSGGASYEAVISVPSHTAVTPLSGMSANVQLAS
jgi:multidrug efflux pump subunit AcrA (membrane-fusion protein)